jgi:hypothetical protein
MSNRLTNDQVRKLGRTNPGYARAIRRGEVAPSPSEVRRIRAALYEQQFAEEKEWAEGVGRPGGWKIRLGRGV